MAAIFQKTNQVGVSRLKHIRTQIRDAVAKKIKSINGLTVFNSFALTITDAELPAANVVTTNENSSPIFFGGGSRTALDVDLRLFINLYLKGSTSSAAADDLCAEIQELMYSDQRLGGLVRCLDYVSFSHDHAREGDGTHTIVSLEFSINYNVPTDDLSQPY